MAEAPADQTQEPSNGQFTSPAPTTQREKNPKRVAAGKAVAEKNRQAREAQKKALEKANAIIAENDAKKSAAAVQETASVAPVQEAAPKNTGGISFCTVMAVGGLLVGAAGVYYQREAIQERLQFLAPKKKESAPSPRPVVASEPAPAPTPAPKNKTGIRSME